MSNVTLVWGAGANLRGSGVSRKVIEWRLTVFLQEGRKGRMDAGEDDAVDEEQTTLEIDRDTSLSIARLTTASSSA